VGYAQPTNDGEREILSKHNASEDWGSTRSTTSLRLDRAADILEDLPVDECICGDWHSHPPDESTQPSQRDLESWGALAEEFGRTDWVGIIVSERHDERGCYDTEIAAYLVRWQSGAVVHRALEISTWEY